MKKISILILLFLPLLHFAQPGSINMTPIKEFQSPLVPNKIIIPAKFKGLLDSTKTINIPRGYQAQLFYMGGLTKPRVLEFGPNGVLHVIDYKTNGAVYALPDNNKDDVADSLVAVVTGVYAHDFKFYKDAIYVAEENRVLKCTDTNKDGFFETKTVFIDSVGLRSNNPVGGHKSRTILFDTLNDKIYLSIGSSCNVCRDEEKAVIEQYNIDGTGRRIFASGIRNAVGMTLHDGKLWANNNGSDQQGNDVPPEWIDIIRDGGYYGFPFAYANQVWFNMEAHADYRALKPITKIDSNDVAQMQEPQGLIQAHSAPMELEYSGFASYGAYNGFFTALRGSWNRTPATGYKVIFLELDKSLPFKSFEGAYDFLTGFLTDSVKRTYWGRPVGLAIKQYHLRDPDVYVCSDEVNRFVLKLTCGTCAYLGQTVIHKPFPKAYPNPFSNTIYFDRPLSKETLVKLYDLQGKEIRVEPNVDFTEIVVPGLPTGLYFLRLQEGQQVLNQKLFHVNE